MCNARKLLYPALYLGTFPIYALLTFALELPFALAVTATVALLTTLLLLMEVGCGIFSRNRAAKQRWALDAYYIGMGIVVSTLLAYGYVVVGSQIGPFLAVLRVLQGKSVVMECLAAILVMDFCAYWIHRLQHRSERSLLWRSHAVHHALPILDIVAGAQVHVVDGMISASPLLLLAALGFSHEACAAAFVMNLTSAGLHHSGLCEEPDWFNFLTIAPKAHRWHHADFAARTVNFGFVLALWDMLFGTFANPRRAEPARYGATSIETFPDSVADHIRVGMTGKAYDRLVKLGAMSR